MRKNDTAIRLAGARLPSPAEAVLRTRCRDAQKDHGILKTEASKKGVQKKRRKKNYSSDVVRVFVLVANRSDGSRGGKHKKGIKRGQ
jgi:hypothetical protein